MRLAISPTTPGLSVPDLVDLCRYAEDLGYEEAWTSEVAGPEAFVTSAAVAAATNRLDVGVAVVPAYTRTPATLAMAAASISQTLDGRRFALGIGSSSQTIVLRWNGIPFERPLARVRETVEATRACLTGDDEYDGTTVAMSRFRLGSPPAGPVELYVGALGPKMLQTAGAVGDGVCLNFMPPRVVARQLDEIRAGAEAAGRALPDGFGVMARLHTIVTDDLPATRDMLRARVLGGYLAQGVYNRFLRWWGREQEAEAILDGWAARDRDAVAAAMSDDLVDDVTVIGDAATVRNRLEEFAAAGITVAAINVLVPDRAVVEDTLRALAPGA